ncbi:MAG: tetratricopeptide repeat protein [Lentisphaerales bacterium]|nr:MAG: tetratricopeptide repeat protein [Lentisphaerales bacterium]
MKRCSPVVAVASMLILISPVALAQIATEGGESKDPDFVELLRTAKDATRKGDWARAEKIFRRAIELRPKDEESQFLLGTALIQTGQFREALERLEQLEKEFPDKPEVKNNLAWILIKSTDPSIRNPKRGLRYAREAVLAQPSDLNMLGTLAEAHYQLGNHDKAVRIARIVFAGAKMRGASNFAEYGNLLRRCLRAAGVTEDESGLD